MSHRYGADENYVLAGGGNTSYKEDNVLYVKGSGARLSDIKSEQFVAMDTRLLCAMAEADSVSMTDEEREEKALVAMMAARLPGEEAKRPSVESILHAIFPYRYVLHVHPALINGLVCSATGKSVCSELFGDEVVWISLTKPGLVLAQVCKKAFDEYAIKTGKYPRVVLLENHGVFAAADSVVEIDALMELLTERIKSCISEEPDFSGVFGAASGKAVVCFDDTRSSREPITATIRESACQIARALRMLYSNEGRAVALFCTGGIVSDFVSDSDAFNDLVKPFTPDHIVYCKDEPMFIEPDADFAAGFSEYSGRKGYCPKIIAVRGLGFFALGQNRVEAGQAYSLFLDAMKIAVYAGAFGGISPLPDDFSEFILNWEAEKYRSSTSASKAPVSAGSRLLGRIAVVTGGAQGFGKGIVKVLASEGAYIGIADLNITGAAECAAEINEEYGSHIAVALAVDVSADESVKAMIQDTILAYGGLDILVSNAGVLIAGGLAEMTKEKFDFVTNVNYTGYFLCTKYACEPMKIQRSYAPDYLMDVIEINSKSGLEGSNKNFAYAGSKFGGIGLTQSFAKELVEYGIKVNAICPGNLLDGPLWSDPERGLFRQYLDSGKVSGAKTLDDVRKFYEDKVPLKRGCTIEDVALAIIYAIEQKYETGQAIPVTGGQLMLR